MNIRLKKAVGEVRKASERLEALVLDLATRETDQAYQKAKKLFDEGARMFHDEDASNRYEEIIMECPSGIGRTLTVYLAGGSDRNSKEQWDLVGAASSKECDNVIRHLLNLTEEERG